MPPQTTLFEFGPYQVEEILGQGAAATVYSARRQGRPVALKVLSGQAAAQVQIRELFFREYRLVSRLRHPAIIGVLDIGEIDGRFYMAMDRVDGETLEELLTRRKSLGETPAVDITRQIAAALAYIHGGDIIHRDVKPGNILVTPQGRAYLFDFGTALDRNNPTPSDGQGIFGTPAFIAPEQVLSGIVDGRADLYSLGVVLYRAVSGRKPFYGDRGEVLEAHQHESPPKPSEFAYISPGLEQIILRLLAKAPEQRYQTGEELIQALDQAELAPERTRGEFPHKVMTWLRGRVLP